MQSYQITIRTAYGFLCTFPVRAESKGAAVKAARGAGTFVSIK